MVNLIYLLLDSKGLFLNRNVYLRFDSVFVLEVKLPLELFRVINVDMFEN